MLIQIVNRCFEEFKRLADRKKEMFKTSGGKYVAPQLLENKLKESFFIEQAMVDAGIRLIKYWLEVSVDVQDKRFRDRIEDPRKILPYEDAARFLAAQEDICVATCPCRHRKNLDPDSPDCKHSTEVCLHFGGLARYMVDHGMARAIDMEEAQEILHKSAEEGLVHGISNWVEGVDSICNCCRCCCVKRGAR